MYNIIVASGIMSFALIFSAAMISGNLDFKKSNIIKTDNGYIKLGKVYNERALIDVKIYLLNNSAPFIEAEDLSIESFMKGIEEKIQINLDFYNKNSSENNKLSMEILSLKVPATLTVRAHIKYNSEFQPNFDLTLENKEIVIYENVPIHKQISDQLNLFVKSKKEEFNSNFYLK
jgi:hypothetical protein